MLYLRNLCSRSRRFSPIFSFISFVDSDIIFRSIIQFELIFVYCVSLVQNPREHLLLGAEAKRTAVGTEQAMD